MTRADYQRHVQAGAALLDQKRPGWVTSISQYALNMASPCDCVLGQVYGHYGDGLRNLVDPDTEEWEYGFYPHPDDTYDRESYRDCMNMLLALWVAEINKRLLEPRTEAS